MDSHRDDYTINPETGRKIKIDSPTWKRLAAKYNMIDGTFTDQPIPDSRAYLSNKVWDENTGSMKAASKPKHAPPRKELVIPSVNESILLWEANHGTSDISNTSEIDMNSVRSENNRCLNSWTRKRRDEKHDEKILRSIWSQSCRRRLSDVIQLSLGYALTYYHTLEGNMYKEWMNEKRTKKDFRLNNEDTSIWVRLPGEEEKASEEVEPINLIFDESYEFNEIA